MPSLQDLNTVGQIVNPFVKNLLNRNAANKVTSRFTEGANRAASQITSGSTNMSALNKDILKQQQEALNPYAEAGAGGLKQYQERQGELTKPFSFTMPDLENDPGYQFRLKEGTKIINRAGNASLSRFSGGTLKALQGYTQGLASQEFADAYQRQEGTFRANQKTATDYLRDLTGIGETATGRNAAALSEYGNRETANQANKAEQLAFLEQVRAQAEADGDTETVNQTGSMIDAITGGLSGLAALSGLGALGGGGSLEAAAVAKSAYGGGSKLLGGLQHNPYTIPIAAGIIGVTSWLKSQAKWEANDLVQNVQNPFDQKMDAFNQQFTTLAQSGQLTKQDAIALRQAAVEAIQAYTQKRDEFATKGKDARRVVDQAIKTSDYHYGPNFSKFLANIDSIIAGLQ